MKSLISNLSGIRRVLSFIASVIIALPLSSQAAYPDRPITIVVPFAQGGPTDKIATPLAAELSRILNQPVQLRYHTGAGGTKAPAALVAQPDTSGHTLLIHHIGMATAPILYRRLAYNPQRDFMPIGRIADAPMIVMARKGLVPKGSTLKGYVQSNQSTLMLGYAGAGSASQLCALLLQDAMDIDLMWLPYRGTKPAMRDLRDGRIDLLCDQTTQAIPAIKSGQADPYMLTTRERLSVIDTVPTARQAGYEALELSIWHGLYAAKGTDPAIVARLTAALNQAVQSPGFEAAMSAVGVNVTDAADRPPDALREHIVRESQRFAPLIRKTSMYAD